MRIVERALVNRHNQAKRKIIVTSPASVETCGPEIPLASVLENTIPQDFGGEQTIDLLIPMAWRTRFFVTFCFLKICDVFQENVQSDHDFS